MLAYRHLFHAGNFADVFKHALLVRLVLALGKKEKPFFILDTHAGTARYDLRHPWAMKNAEFREGIQLVWGRRNALAVLEPYLDAVRAENADGTLRFYPGSPRVARRLMRPGDRMVLTELNRTDAAELQALFKGDRQVKVALSDGYQALKAYLPPKERRGLVFIDSSFDRAGEFQRLTKALVEAQGRWATGVFAIWYPLMGPSEMQAFDRRIVASGIRKVLQVELSVHPENWTASLRGSGMVVVNPPFGFDAEAREIVDWLWPVLAPGGAGGRALRWLVPE